VKLHDVVLCCADHQIDELFKTLSFCERLVSWQVVTLLVFKTCCVRKQLIDCWTDLFFSQTWGIFAALHRLSVFLSDSPKGLGVCSSNQLDQAPKHLVEMQQGWLALAPQQLLAERAMFRH